MLYGADSEALEALAAEMTSGADRLDAIGAGLRSALMASPWDGPDADGFRLDWDGPHVARLTAASAALRNGSSLLAAQAGEQRTASAAGGAGGGAAGLDPAAVAAALPGLQALGPDARPEDVAAFFAALPPGVGLALARQNPELVGNLEGAPVALRYEANNARIASAAADARAAGNTERAESLEGWITNPDGTATGRRFLLFDPAGDGRVAEVLGADPTEADNVAFFVPGTGADIESFDGDVSQRADAYLEAIRNFAEGDADSTSVIAWLGYDAPDDVVRFELDPRGEAMQPGFATDGAPNLVDGVEGLQLADDVNVSVIGHSYGTTLLGSALHQGLAVDNVVAMGSPGMFVDHASEFGLGDGTNLYTMEAPLDYVTWTEVYGSDPNDPASGFHRLDTGPIAGHSGYFNPTSLAAENIAYVITGHPESLDGRGRSPAEFAFLPVDAARDIASGSHDAANSMIDSGQERLPGPVGVVVDPLVDGAQAAADFTHDVADTSVEAVEDVVDAGGGFLNWLNRKVNG